MAHPAPADNFSGQEMNGETSPSSTPADFSTLSIPSRMGGVPDRAQTIRAPAALIADFKEVISDVRTSIHEFLSEHLRSSSSSEGKNSRFGFLAAERGEVSVAEVREALERSMDLCESIAGHRGDGMPVWDNIRALSNQFQLNAQTVLIEMRSGNVGETIPSGSLIATMRLFNQMQGVARQTAIQLDAVTRATMS
jgi:hypothetical protein